MSPENIAYKDKYQTLFDTMSQGVVYQKADGAIFDVNRAAERILGLSRDQIMGRTSMDPRWCCVTADGHPLPGEDHPAMVALRTGVPVTDYLMGVFLPDLEQFRWILVSATPQFKDGESSPFHAITTFTDITTRKNAEDALRASEIRYRNLFESMQEGVALHEVVFNEDGLPTDYRFIDINPAYQKLTGLSRDQVIGKTVREALPQIEDHWIDTFCQVAITGKPAAIERYVPELDRHFRTHAFSPELNKFVVIFDDVTEQKRSDMAIKESEERFHSYIDSSPHAVFVANENGRYLEVNPAATTITGYSADELLMMGIFDLLPPESLEWAAQNFKQVVETGHSIGESAFRRKNGEICYWSLAAVKLSPTRFLGFVTDITDMKRSTRTLELYSYALNNARDSIFLLGSDARFQYVNNAVCETLGYSRQELLEMHVFDIDPDFPPEIWEKHWDELRKKEELRVETKNRARDGSMIPMEINIRFFLFEGNEYLLSLARNLTERKKFEDERLKLEQQLLHAQKLESLGVLAGGIAHDFNNILMAIIGNADLALMKVNKESPAVENLQRIEQAAARAADLAKQMLAYSGKGRFVVEQLDLNRLLEEMLHMLEVSISKKAVLRFNLHTPLPAVEADATQIRQIVMNLVINASEAIGDKSGVIAITTGCMDCDRSYLKDVWLNENLTDGLYVYLEIADSGCGMNHETLAKIFDPFFTTKFTGRGLGMAAVLGIVRGHKGAIKVYSEMGKGSSFKILLPASSRPADLFNGHSNGDNWHGSGTVLLVDDEETVRGIGAEMLRELGFTPITANDGRDALDVFKQNPDISFVILDLTMPHVDGEQCYRELRQLKPDVKVIISSGYNEQEVTQKFVGKGLAGFIQKPYKLSVLKEAVRQLQDNGADQ
jgi:PAS domain S-box-containing protein